MSDNKLFLKVIKPSLSDKSCDKERSNLLEKGKILKTYLEVIITFFGNIVKNFDIIQYSNFDPVINDCKDTTLKAILKYEDHPSIRAIQNKYKNEMKFTFEELDLANVEKEIHELKMKQLKGWISQPKLERKMLTFLQHFYGKV